MNKRHTQDIPIFNQILLQNFAEQQYRTKIQIHTYTSFEFDLRRNDKKKIEKKRQNDHIILIVNPSRYAQIPTL